MEQKKSGWEKIGPILVVVIVGMAFGLGYFYNKAQSVTTTPAEGTQQAGAAQVQPTPKPVSANTIKGLFTNKDLISFGDANKKVLFVEVSDPSCPFCHVAAGKNGDLNSQIGERFKLVEDGGTYVAPVPEMKKLVDAGKASFVYIYSPGHGNGEMGTKALYCADEKGKFWDVHDLLMNGQGYDLLNNTVRNDKAQAGTLAEFLSPVIDASFMQDCLESGKYDGRIAEDTQLAQSLGVQGTPGFFINTTNFAGAYGWTDMSKAVDLALQ